MIPRRVSSLVALLALVGIAFGSGSSLTWDDETTGVKEFVVLVSYGDGDTSISVVGPGDDEPYFHIDTPICDVGKPTISEHSGVRSNYTYPVTFSGAVGVVSFTISTTTTVLTGKIIAAGFVVMEKDRIVSGDGGDGVSVGEEGKFTFDVTGVNAKGQVADLWGAIIKARPTDGGTDMGEIDMKDTMLFNDKLVISIKKFRIGSGRITLTFDIPSIYGNGESFETLLYVRQDTSARPPCVVDGPRLVAKDGFVEAKMYNLLSPPLSYPVKEFWLTVGETSFLVDKERSMFALPVSTVVFKGVTAYGSAKISCDEEPAVIVEDGIETDEGLSVSDGGGNVASGDGDSEPLAVDTLIQDTPTSDTEAVISSVVRVVDEDPSTLTQSTAEAILVMYMKKVSSSDAVITSIVKGSAVITFAAVVSDEEEASEKLSSSFDDCSFQTSLGYDCDKLVLSGVKVENAVAATTAGAAGIATWTIVLIASVGALSLVAVVVLSLWAVHRRSSQMSESDYSSSGPLGVPDPSDMLYEQSIVRDIYGRGEDGGPSVQTAVEREREAAMREEFPLPPSSSASGITRMRAASIDASSTYSV